MYGNTINSPYLYGSVRLRIAALIFLSISVVYIGALVGSTSKI